MKKLLIFSTYFLLLSLSIPPPGNSLDLTLYNTPVQVCFSPKGGTTYAIIRQIDKAKNDIFIQAYSFTSQPIAKALISAYKKGIKVQAILDKSQKSEKYTAASFLANMGIPTFIDSNHAIAHNKIMIIDRETVITGSFNFTKAAEEKNVKNLLILPF